MRPVPHPSTTEPGTPPPPARLRALEALVRAGLARYERLFAGRAYMRKADAEPAMETIRALKRQYGIADRRARRLAPGPPPVQLSLAV